MFSNDSYIGMNAYHQTNHMPKNGASSIVLPGQTKGFAIYNHPNNKISHSLLPKNDTSFTGLESQIAQLWKTSSDSYVSTDEVWKFNGNTISDYSSLSSASVSPEDHRSEAFFNVASQLQRQTPPDLKLRQNHDQAIGMPDYVNFFDHKSSGNMEGMVKSSLCCQFILNGQCDRGDNCIFAHNVMELGQPV